MDRTQRTLETFLDAAPWYAAVVVAFGVLVWITLRIKARFRDGADPAGDPRAMLAHFRELQREGGLSEEEFRSIKGRLMDRIDGSTSAQDALPQDRSPTAARRGRPDERIASPPAAGQDAEGRDDTARSTHSEG
ncbi:MAG: hypothetical protein WD066_00505 [Planctomycetaceae bacterium]